MLESVISDIGGVNGVPTLVEYLSKIMDEVDEPELDEPKLDADDAMVKLSKLGRKGVFS